jgi:hypothetical protein
MNTILVPKAGAPTAILTSDLRDRAKLGRCPSGTRADQNSAGRYPLISSPMQISTSVGVVHAIGRLRPQPLVFD